MLNHHGTHIIHIRIYIYILDQCIYIYVCVFVYVYIYTYIIYKVFILCIVYISMFIFLSIYLYLIYIYIPHVFAKSDINSGIPFFAFGLAKLPYALHGFHPGTKRLYSFLLSSMASLLPRFLMMFCVRLKGIHPPKQQMLVVVGRYMVFYHQKSESA